MKSVRLTYVPTVLTALVCSCLLLPKLAVAFYVLAPGDVIEVSVPGFPEYQQRADVDADGDVTLPMVGSIRVAGTDLDKVRAQISRAYASVPARFRTPDGRVNVSQIYPEEVTVRLAEYRPVYIDGDVARPGSLPFRPDLTVEKAIALAGGIDVSHGRSRDFVLERADVEAEQGILQTETAAQLAAIREIRRELDATSGSADQAGQGQASQAARSTDASALVVQELQARQSSFENDLRAAQQRVEQAKAIAASTEQQSQQLKGLYDAQVALTHVLQRSAQQGGVSQLLLIENERQLSLTLEGAGQAETRAIQARRDIQEVSRQAQKLGEQQRLDLLKELQETLAKLQATGARATAAEEKLAYLSGRGAEIGSASGRDAEVEIRRAGTGDTIAVGAMAPVSAGDVIYVKARRASGDAESLKTSLLAPR